MRCRMQLRPDKDFPSLTFWHCFVDGEWVRLADLLDTHRLHMKIDIGLLVHNPFTKKIMPTYKEWMEARGYTYLH